MGSGTVPGFQNMCKTFVLLWRRPAAALFKPKKHFLEFAHGHCSKRGILEMTWLVRSIWVPPPLAEIRVSAAMGWGAVGGRRVEGDLEILETCLEQFSVVLDQLPCNKKGTEPRGVPGSSFMSPL